MEGFLSRVASIARRSSKKPALVRMFSAIPTTLPSSMVDLVRQEAGDEELTDPKKSSLVATKATSLLAKKYAVCAETKGFVTSMASFDGSLLVESKAEDQTTITNLGLVMGSMLNHRLISPELSQKFTRLKPINMVFGRELVENFNPHTDFSSTEKEKVSLIMMSGLLSKGLIRTYVISFDDVLKGGFDLFTLSMPIFDNEHRSGARPILYAGKDGKPNFNFDFGFVVDEEAALKHGINPKKANKVLEKLVENIKQLHQDGKLESFYIKRGDILIVDNERNLHGRDEVLPAGAVVDDAFEEEATTGKKPKKFSVDSMRVIVVSGFSIDNPSGKFKSAEFTKLAGAVEVLSRY